MRLVCEVDAAIRGRGCGGAAGGTGAWGYGGQLPRRPLSSSSVTDPCRRHCYRCALRPLEPDESPAAPGRRVFINHCPLLDRGNQPEELFISEISQNCALLLL